jgi:hypothetical protein
MKVRTGDLARALVQEGFPVATDDMVRSWCEAGEIEYWKNPVGQGHYFLQPQSTLKFLKNYFQYDSDKITRIAERVGWNLNQKKLF